MVESVKQASDMAPEVVQSRTLVRGITVLEAVATMVGGASVTAVAASAGLDKGTVSRLLATLRDLGYVRQRESDRQYELGSRCLWLAQEYRASYEELIGVAQPYIVGLRDASHETVHLAVREGLNMVYVAQLEPDRQVRVSSAVGQRLPLHRTAMGRAILAAMPVDERTALLQDIKADVERAGGTLDLTEIEAEIQRAKSMGWAAVDRHDEVTRLASAILSREGRPVAAITLSGPSYRVTARLDEFGELVVATAKAVTAALRG